MEKHCHFTGVSQACLDFFASPHFIVRSVTSVGKSNCATSNLINVGGLTGFVGCFFSFNLHWFS